MLLFDIKILCFNKNLLNYLLLFSMINFFTFVKKPKETNSFEFFGLLSFLLIRTVMSSVVCMFCVES